MEKQNLLKTIDAEFLDKLFGFCYARTNDSYEAQELCSDILFALTKSSKSGGEIDNAYAFIWKIARNVYADFCEEKKKRSLHFSENAPAEFPAEEACTAEGDDDRDQLDAIFGRMAFLTRTYREVMIYFYLDGLSTAEIAQKCKISESSVRQRLFQARNKIKNEVTNMDKTIEKPVILDNIEYEIIGTGNPSWGDPRDVLTRQFSKHILWLCHKKPQTVNDIVQTLNTPTVYVEEELNILAAGANGKYGLLRKLDNGKYAINFILLDARDMDFFNRIYENEIPKISDSIIRFAEQHREEYLAVPCLNHKKDFNLILWQQIFDLSCKLQSCVERILSETYFSGQKKPDRPFSVYGYVDNGKTYGCGRDGISAANLCGYSQVFVENIYVSRIQAHFHCSFNIANDPLLQLAIRAVNGLNTSAMSGKEKEHAAKAVECGYLYREGSMVYTKILIYEGKDLPLLHDITRRLEEDPDYIRPAETIARQIADFINRTVPDYLLGEWSYVNALAALPVLDGVIEVLIEKGILAPPKDGIGAEGCWMSLEK